MGGAQVEDGSRAADQMEERREAPPPQRVASLGDPGVSNTISASFGLAIALKFTLLERIEEKNSIISS